MSDTKDIIENIDIVITNGNVNINSNCSPEGLMQAISVLTASMSNNSDNTLEELTEIIQKNALNILENNNLSTKKIGEEDDI